jgi:tRNA-2-methylthio-N6-dimethylallyladenosine synthase
VAKKFLVRTFGCQMNEHDSERLAHLFAAEGMERTERLEDADLVVLNTCCIRENADNKLYGHLGHLKSVRDRRPELQIAVGGCLAQKDRELLAARAPHVDAIFGTHNIGRAPALLAEAKASGRPVIEILDGARDGEVDFSSAMAVRHDLPFAAWLTIQVGCDNACAFCIVPSVRGPEVSRGVHELLDEVRRLAARGTSEITLLGQNVNSYGRDLTTTLRAAERAGERPSPAAAGHLAGERFASERPWRARPLFADLLREVGGVEGIRRVRFTSPHPKDLRPETIEAMASTPAVCEQLHLPLQSGSDAVLAAMRRGYSSERYLERLAAARAAIPDLAVTTDLIVGFPGETERDFSATLEVVAAARFDGAYTFIFSPRPGTRAASLEARFVPPEVITDRFARLKVVVDRAALAANRARVGRLEEIVIEGVSRRDSARFTGRTRQGKLVHVPPPSGAAESGPGPFVGRYGTARIDSAGAHHLIGELVDVEPARPAAVRARVRIPLRESPGALLA